MKHINNISGIIIICIGIFVTGMVVWTVKKAVSHPVQMENLYQTNYHNVDYTYNDIIRDIKLFDTKYELFVDTKNLHRGTNQILLSIKQDNNYIKNANITLLLTRPHTNSENQTIQTKIEQNSYQSESFVIQNRGRYKLLVKIDINNLKVHKEYKFFIN